MSVLPLGYEHKVVSNPPAAAGSAYISVAAGDVLRYSPPHAAMVLRWGFIATTTVNDVTNALKLSCDLRPTAGSDTGRLRGRTFTVAAGAGYNAAGAPAIYLDYGAVAAGTTMGLGGGTITLAGSATQVVAGQGVFHNMNPQAPTGSTVAAGLITVLGGYYPDAQPAFLPPGGLPTQFMVYPGQEVVIASQATAPGAGAGIFFLEVGEFPLTASGNNNGIAATGIPAGISPTPSNSGSRLTLVRA